MCIFFPMSYESYLEIFLKECLLPLSIGYTKLGVKFQQGV
ncbi:hypothetical protein DEU44_3299 [Priestia megaterium]|jgi:hypothetical protein|nr:hypothetical protein DEU44_3299 [Priestia megaterium]